ncbi:hypothetical protein GTR02_01570 [Kineococcus sp. R8]|uniref:hypothetical protein n=1 Tax=Kineococcus siccus TaxID=2696567 RepID=UPI001412EF79|nr:hypothetical protein [Kineococcus siccus]NAZ80506.1 hypothetical protein [Kineococcus siccus]
MGVETDSTHQEHGPVWADLAEDHLPRTVPVDVVIGRSEAVVVFLSGFRVVPTGVSLRLSVRLRDGQDAEAQQQVVRDVFDDAWTRTTPAGTATSRLTWWLEFSDGRTASGVDAALREELHAVAARTGAPRPEPSRPVLVGGAGAGVGGSLSVDRDFWLWPLPPAGTLRVHCAWPALGVAPSTVDLDADVLREAASHARRLW